MTKMEITEDQIEVMRFSMMIKKKKNLSRQVRRDFWKQLRMDHDYLTWDNYKALENITIEEIEDVFTESVESDDTDDVGDTEEEV